MTKSHESGHNEITDEARKEATRTGRDVCDILAEMLADAKSQSDKARQKKIERAQKFLGCRNVKKRRSQP